MQNKLMAVSEKIHFINYKGLKDDSFVLLKVLMDF